MVLEELERKNEKLNFRSLKLQKQKMVNLTVTEKKKVELNIPIYGHRNYFDAREQILKDHLKTPTFRDVVDIAYDSIDSKGECADKIKRILLMSGATSFYGFTGVLNSQERVVYIQDHPDVIDNKIVMEESDLVKRLEVKDRSVRFVPFGFKIGEMTSRQLAQNEFVRALAEEEGAEKLAEITAPPKASG